MVFLYRFVIFLYDCGVNLAAPVSLKARKFREGRKAVFTRLENDFRERTGKLVWIHAASLGEFEQGRPVIEGLKQWNPNVKILLTFFSPSGYEVRKDYPLADYVYYLPLDYSPNASRFLAIVKPDLAIFIKYELWYNYLKVLQNHNIPTVLIAAVFRQDQFYFKPFGKFFRQVLKRIDHFYVQDETSGRLLKSIGIEQFTVAGDTRFDRVVSVAENSADISLIKHFKGEKRLLVLGSIWNSDMKLLKPFICSNPNNLKFIIAPHHIDKGEIDSLLSLPDSVAFSAAGEETISRFSVLILDNVGMLSSVYRYGDFAYVGGGVRGALHNTLEAAVYGIPVFFGQHSHNSRFPEVSKLMASGGGFEVKNFEEFNATFERLASDTDLYQKACESAKVCVQTGAGATSRVMSGIKKFIES